MPNFCEIEPPCLRELSQVLLANWFDSNKRDKIKLITLEAKCKVTPILSSRNSIVTFLKLLFKSR